MKKITWLILLLNVCLVSFSSTQIEQCEKELVSVLNQYIQKNKLESPTDVKLMNKTLVRPVIAITEAEMLRLKSAYASSGTEHNFLVRRFSRVDSSIEAGVNFPPEGGQHNQWYQCDSCQIGLITIDAHHHQCPACRKVYSGFPYDNVLYKGQHIRNISLAVDAAWAWAVTKEKKYADFSAAVLKGYAERYLNYPMVCSAVNDKNIDVASEKRGKYPTAGHILPETLSEASSLISLAIAYDLIYNYLPEQEKYQIESKLLRPMAESIDIYKAGKKNWQTWHNAALLYAGAVMGDALFIRKSLLDEENGFTAQMKNSITTEGMWYENSWGYHYYALSAMTYIAEGARRLGFDIYSFPPLRKMYFLAFDYLMSDGSLPRFGDAVQDSPRQQVNEKAWAAYKDDRLLAALPSEVTWDGIILGRTRIEKTGGPKSGSKLFPGAGHAILATNGPGKLTAAITFGPYGGTHGHFDKLSFVFFGFGEELGIDPGRAASQAYRLPIHKDWYKASTGHNTVLVDGNSQQPASGKCLAYNSTDSFAAVAADAGTAYNNVSHKRFMLLSANYLLILDELNSLDKNEHSFDWLYHNKGLSITCNLPESNRKPGNIPSGYAYLKDLSGFSSEKNQLISAIFNNPKTNLHLKMVGQKGDEVFTATGPFTSIKDRVPVVIVRRKGKAVRFATLLEPVASNGKAIIKSIELTSEDNSFVAILKYDGHEDRISFSENKLENFLVEQKTGNELKILLKAEPLKAK